MSLKQGDHSVHEYVQIFNELALNAPHQVYTDQKKRHCFLEGLDTKLWAHMVLNARGNFNELMSDAITKEDALRAHHGEKGKKWMTSSQSSGARQK
jgi:hypothetical protein